MIKENPDRYRWIQPHTTFDYLLPKENKMYDLKFRIVRFKISDTTYETLFTNLSAFNILSSRTSKEKNCNSYEERISAVEKYLRSECSMYYLSKQLKVGKTTIQQWLAGLGVHWLRSNWTYRVKYLGMIDRDHNLTSLHLDYN